MCRESLELGIDCSPSHNATNCHKENVQTQKKVPTDCPVGTFHTRPRSPALFYRGSIGDKGMTHKISLSGGGGHSR